MYSQKHSQIRNSIFQTLAFKDQQWEQRGQGLLLHQPSKRSQVHIMLEFLCCLRTFLKNIEVVVVLSRFLSSVRKITGFLIRRQRVRHAGGVPLALQVTELLLFCFFLFPQNEGHALDAVKHTFLGLEYWQCLRCARWWGWSKGRVTGLICTKTAPNTQFRQE